MAINKDTKRYYLMWRMRFFWNPVFTALQVFGLWKGIYAVSFIALLAQIIFNRECLKIDTEVKWELMMFVSSMVNLVVVYLMGTMNVLEIKGDMISYPPSDMLLQAITFVVFLIHFLIHATREADKIRG